MLTHARPLAFAFAISLALALELAAVCVLVDGFSLDALLASFACIGVALVSLVLRDAAAEPTSAESARIEVKK